MVGAVRFELTTSCTRNKRATRLRYAPNQTRAGKWGNTVTVAMDFSGKVKTPVRATCVLAEECGSQKCLSPAASRFVTSKRGHRAQKRNGTGIDPLQPSR